MLSLRRGLKQWRWWIAHKKHAWAEAVGGRAAARFGRLQRAIAVWRGPFLTERRAAKDARAQSNELRAQNACRGAIKRWRQWISDSKHRRAQSDAAKQTEQQAMKIAANFARTQSQRRAIKQFALFVVISHARAHRTAKIDAFAAAALQRRTFRRWRHRFVPYSKRIRLFVRKRGISLLRTFWLLWRSAILYRRTTLKPRLAALWSFCERRVKRATIEQWRLCLTVRATFKAADDRLRRYRLMKAMRGWRQTVRFAKATKLLAACVQHMRLRTTKRAVSQWRTVVIEV